MKKHLLPLSIATSVITLFVYACYTCFFPNPFHKPAPDASIIRPADPGKRGGNDLLPGFAETIAAREYHISMDKARQLLQSPNRKHNLRAYYRPGLLTVQNRTNSSDGHFSLSLHNQGIRADGQLIGQPNPWAEPEILGNRLLIRHSKFSEEFINNEEGVRQNFIVEQTPAGTSELEVALTARGVHIQDGGENELLFLTENNKTYPGLIYRDLKCWDAHNRPLTARLTGKQQQILITVDVRNAAYPVTIDPIIVNGNPGNANALLESDQAGALLGFSVASAGDVNADGYSDIIVGESGYDLSNWEYSDEGRVWIYYGSANGLIPNGTILNGQLDNLYFGFSVSGADINGDSYSDVLVGCTFFADGEYYEGAAYVYYGSQTGVTPLNLTIVQSNVMGAQMGNKIATGDFNGDGFNDIAVGATAYSNPENSEGAIFVYYGSGNGINIKPLIIEGNIHDGYFGRVSSAGDVNGDGFSDLVVGSYGYSNGQDNEGAGYLFLGSPNGLISSSNILLQSNQASAFLGNDVAGAGDINGDGFSDIILSAHQYDNGQYNEGKAFIYYGNSALGVRNNLRLYNSDLTTPINHTQFPQPNFGASIFAKSFQGRNKGKLVWETKPVNQGFSKGSNNRITNSTQSTGSQNAYSNLGTTGFELKNVIDKQGAETKVRVRVKYDPVLALTGQSYGPWRYLPAYLMGNSASPVPEETQERLLGNMQPENTQMKSEARSEPVTVYPNPVADRLDIDLKDKDQVESLRIHTASGSVVYQASGFRSWVDVSKLSQGTYFLTITKTDGSHTTRKILIRR
ncbi:FG-GAP-like repeat-containing protein [Dyadobacter sp. OTU695]|uniref:FG-GAP-like repeat-containing protein n=1 Tax=Dyadobacter sp. OTU695 TaxID=3043860 RepID=UPI00313D73E9